MKKIIPFIIWLITGILGRTWRFRISSPPTVNIFDAAAAPKIYCFWHSTLLVVSYMFRNTGKTAIVSKSKDGLIAAEVAKRWGHEAIFGSTRRGGASALRQSIRSIKAGRSLGITPDGPKGPVNIAKPGAAQIAIASGTPIVTIKVETKSAWRLRSWDRFMIPKPFAKIFVTLSEPILMQNADRVYRGTSQCRIKNENQSQNNPYEDGGISKGNTDDVVSNDNVETLTKLLQESLS